LIQKQGAAKMPAWNDYKAEAKKRGALAMELFLVKTNPAGDMDLIKETLPDHLAYQKQMEASGALVMAGPVSDVTGEHMNAEGMIIYRAQNLAAARSLADGARTYEIRKWLVNEGKLSFSMSLSNQNFDLN
jgi:uncharacterized protein YciI